MLSPQQNERIVRVGPGTPMGTTLRSYWLPALLSSELPAADGPPLRVRLLGEDLIAFRASDGQIGLIQNHCPHRGASLFFGRNEEGGLRCVYHGWKFDATGQCVDMPNEPAESNFKQKVKATAYRCHERNGVIWAFMSSGALPELPDIEWNLVPQSQRYITKRLQASNWAQALEGGIDPSHSGFLHAPLHVDPNTASPRERYRLDKHPRFSLLEQPSGLRIGARRNAGPGLHFWSVTHFLMPFYNVFNGSGGQDGEPTLGGFAWVPMDDVTTMAWCFSWNPRRPLEDDEQGDTARVRAGTHSPPSTLLPATSMPGGAWRPMGNASNDYLLDRDVMRSKRFFGVPGISGQDAAVQESMGLVVDRSVEHLGVSDSAVIQVRRLWLQAIEAAAAGLPPLGVMAPTSYRARATGFVIRQDEDWTLAATDWISGQPQASAPVLT